MHAKLILIFILSFNFYQLFCQIPPTILKSDAPPDISESYRANPHFYEIMSAFPNKNSYYMYDIEDVRKKARSDPESMVILGDHYRIGRSTPTDLKRALREYERAASKGYAKADHRIAYMYADGLGLPKEREKILEYLKKSADGGYDLAQYDYALIFLNGKFGEARDLAKAYPYLLKASAQGHRNSTELLAMVSYHAAAPNAGIPAGLETALKYYRQAGDTDGERALMQSISSFGGLRYYLRIIPGFLKGVDASLDPINIEEGFTLLQQLAASKDIIGEENFARYKNEISGNILHDNYHKAQGNRVELLKFLIMCNNRNNWLEPQNARYADAAARDFRLTVNFINENSLNQYYQEFTGYRQLFETSDLPIVADRVFVSLFLKDNSPDILASIVSFLKSESWIISNLSGRYILSFESYEFTINKSNLITKPAIATGYLDDLFDRFAKYRPPEADTLVSELFPPVRAHCIHPLLTEKLYVCMTKVTSTTNSLWPYLLADLDSSISLFTEDINQYFSFLRTDKPFAGSDNLTEINALINQVQDLMRTDGEVKINKLCMMSYQDPARIIVELAGKAPHDIMEMEVAPNNIKLRAIEFDIWSRSLNIRQISFTDPNGVSFIPETIVSNVYNENKCENWNINQHLLLKNEAERYQTWKCEVFNNQAQSVSIRVVLNPIMESAELPDLFDPYKELDLQNTWHSEWLTIDPQSVQQISFVIESSQSPLFWQPLIVVDGQKFLIPYLN